MDWIALIRKPLAVLSSQCLSFDCRVIEARGDADSALFPDSPRRFATKDELGTHCARIPQPGGRCRSANDSVKTNARLEPDSHARLDDADVAGGVSRFLAV